MLDDETPLSPYDALEQTIVELVKSFLGPVASLGPLGKYIAHSYAFDLEDIQRVVFQEMQARLESVGDDVTKRRVLDGYLRDGKRARTLRQGFHAMLDVTASPAWRPLANMTLDYWADGKPVDAFFHDASSVLTQLDAEGIAAAETLLRKAESGKHDFGPGREVIVNHNEPPRQPPHGELNFVHPKALEELPPDPAPPGVPRAIRVLAAYGFGRGGGGRFQVRVDEAPRCWRLLRHLELREGKVDALVSGDTPNP